MRLLAVLLAAVLLASPALAQFGGRAVVAPDGTTAEQLDFWFGQLDAADTDAGGQAITTAILRLWQASGSDTVNLLMDRSVDAINGGHPAVALDMIDGAIAMQPDFAAAWQQRAIVSYTLGDFAGAIADIGRTLALEPRQFVALTGLAQMLHDIGEDDRAMAAATAALAIDPFYQPARDLLRSFRAGQQQEA